MHNSSSSGRWATVIGALLQEKGEDEDKKATICFTPCARGHSFRAITEEVAVMG